MKDDYRVRFIFNGNGSTPAVSEIKKELPKIEISETKRELSKIESSKIKRYFEKRKSLRKLKKALRSKKCASDLFDGSIEPDDELLSAGDVRIINITLR